MTRNAFAKFNVLELLRYLYVPYKYQDREAIFVSSPEKGQT